MGFWNALKGQLGRDTGRVISDSLWKGRQASVHRHIIEREAGRRMRRERQEKRDALELEEKSLKFEEKKEKFEEKKEKRKKLGRFSEKIEDKIQAIDELALPDGEGELVKLLSQLSYLMKANPFQKEEEGEKARISNLYAEAIFAKYEQAYLMLGSFFPGNAMLPAFGKTLRQTRWKRFFCAECRTYPDGGGGCRPGGDFAVLCVYVQEWGLKMIAP